MKVAVITQYFPNSHQQWAGHSAYQTLRILAQRCELKVFYPEAVYPKAVRWRSLKRPACDPSYRPGGMDTQYIPYVAVPVISRPLNGWQAGRRLLPHVRQFKPDIILSYVVYPDGFAALRIAEALKIPLVVKAIGSDLNRISDRLCGILTRKVLRQAALVTTVSGHLLERSRQLGADPHRSCAILNGCDTSIFRPRDPADSRRKLGIQVEGPVLVYVGRLDVRKGLRELVQAVAILRAKRPDLRCYIVGDGPDRPILMQAIEEHKAQDSVQLIAASPTEQVALWMSAADVFTLPSYAEGCPNVVVEALASGRPIVASHVGGIPELMDEAVGSFVQPKDPKGLASALEDVLSREWDAAAISAHHSRTWSDVADDLHHLLNQTLASTSPSSPSSRALPRVPELGL